MYVMVYIFCSLKLQEGHTGYGRGVKTITTRPPAVTDVFDSGRNVGALRPGRRVGFR